jgi:hypothetical protein
MIKNEINSQNKKPRNSIRDRINFFSEKGKIEEKKKNLNIPKKINRMITKEYLELNHMIKAKKIKLEIVAL